MTKPSDTTYEFAPTRSLRVVLDGDSGAAFFPKTALNRPAGALVNDVSVVPSDARYVALNGTAKHLDLLGRCEQIEALWATGASDPLMRQISGLNNLRAVFLRDVRAPLQGLEGAKSLEHLFIADAPTLVDLSFLAELPALQTASFGGVKRVDLDTLPQLPRISNFEIFPSVLGKVVVPDLAPMRRLSGLRRLLLDVQPMDRSLAPLAELRCLESVAHLPETLAPEEYARLAGALPGASGPQLRPLSPPLDARHWSCAKCGGQRQRFVGAPRSIVCPRCDTARIERRVTRWEIARASIVR